jgi:SEC-C motif-containing protein
MRSRYSAFVVGDADYLLRTHHPSTRPATLDLDPGIRWYRLDILGRTRGGVLDTEGEVEFRASYRFDGEVGEQHERSTFVRDRGAWSYLSAV